MRGFGFHKETGLPVHAKVVIGAAGGCAALDHHLPLARAQPGAVTHIPAQRFKERVNKIQPHLGFVVIGVEIIGVVVVEFIHQRLQLSAE